MKHLRNLKIILNFHKLKTNKKERKEMKHEIILKSLAELNKSVNGLIILRKFLTGDDRKEKQEDSNVQPLGTPIFVEVLDILPNIIKQTAELIDKETMILRNILCGNNTEPEEKLIPGIYATAKEFIPAKQAIRNTTAAENKY